eukprot:513735_1
MKLLLLLATAAVCAAADISVNLDLDDTPTSLRRGRKLARVDCNGPFSEVYSCPEDTTRYTCEEGEVLCCTWANLPVASPRGFRRQFRINRLVAEFRTDRTGVCTIDLDDESSSEDSLDEDLRLGDDSSEELDDEDSSEDILDELLDEEAEEFDFDDEDFDEEYTEGSDE